MQTTTGQPYFLTTYLFSRQSTPAPGILTSLCIGGQVSASGFLTFELIAKMLEFESLQNTQNRSLRNVTTDQQTEVLPFFCGKASVCSHMGQI
jgi:hypothetical protein